VLTIRGRAGADWIAWVSAALLALALAMASLAFTASSADAVTGTMERGYSGNTHHRKNWTNGGGLGWTHMHYAIIDGCNYSGTQLGTATSTVQNSATNGHSLYKTVSQSGPGNLNAGIHHFFADAGDEFWSPGGENGWDICWP
jgi:hypothetical protein